MTDKKEKPILGLAGRYQLTKHKVDIDGNVIPGTEEVVLPWFDNVITDYGLNSLGSSSPLDNLSYCRIGTGATTPTTTDTQLVTQVASTSAAGIGDNTVGYGPSSSYIFRRVCRRFAAGSASGVNLTEVGMSASTTGANIFSRSLLKDSGGVPTTITLAADEVLDVLYELRLYAPAAETTTTATIDGVSTTVTMRTHAFNVWAQQGSTSATARKLGCSFVFNPSSLNGCSGARETQGSATQTGYLANYFDGRKDGVGQAYVANSLQRTIKYSFALSDANYASGIGAVGFMGSSVAGDGDTNYGVFTGLFSWGFSPKLNKTSARTAEVVVGISWGRYTP